MSTSDSIRKGVGAKISDATKTYTANQPAQQRREAFNALGTNTSDRYLSVFKAAAAFHSKSGEGRSPSDLPKETKEAYIAGVQALMDKRNLSPAGENGRITPEQYQNEFSPQEVMKFAVSRYLEENKNRPDEAKKELKQAVEDLPPDITSDAAKTAASAPAWVSDEAFLNLSEEEQNTYIESRDGVEQRRLTELLRNKPLRDHDPKEVAKTNIDYNDPDPNTHPDEKDDFKIESGDIIEYLMKDVILAGTAWALNRPAGFIGAIAYEGGHKIKSKMVDKWDAWHRSSGESNNNNPPAPPTPYDPKKHILLSVDNTEPQLRPWEEILDKQKNKPKEVIEKEERLFRNLSKHYQVITDDEDIIFWNDKEKKYETLTPKQDSSKIAEYRTLQNDLTHLARKHFIEFAGDKEKAANAFDEYIKALDAAAINHDDKMPAFPKEPPEFTDMWHKAHEKAARDLEFEQIGNKIITEKELFSAYYGQYLALEYFKQNKDNEGCATLSSEENLNAFLTEKQKEASVIFFTAQKLRAEGKPIPSNEELILLAKNQFNASAEDVKKDKTTPVNDTVNAKIDPPKEQKEIEDFATAAQKNITREDALTHQIADIDVNINGLEGDSAEITKKREALNETKRRLAKLNGTENKTENNNKKMGTVYAHGYTGEQR